MLPRSPLPLASVPFDEPWPLVLGAAAVAGVLLLLWSQSGARALLVGALLALAVAAGSVVADRLVVTDREAVDRLFATLAAAAEAGDTATILAAFDPARAGPRAEAERALRVFRLDDVRVTRTDVTVEGSGPGRKARADLLVHARGTFRDGSGAGPGNVLVDLGVDLREASGRWLITDFERRDGRPLDRRSPAEQVVR